MMTVLLLVIFLTFIGVGLPDSLLGAAWPVMHADMHLPISLAGYVTTAVSACTTVSSLLSARLINRFGTGAVCAVSTLLTALALLGYATGSGALCLFLLAIPLGLGAGAIDTALNNFVAIHYTAAQMNFLHCFYGLGVSISPYVMSLALGSGGNWRRGYLIVACIQMALSVIAFAALPLWRKVQTQEVLQQEEARTVPLLQLMKNPAVRAGCLAFFAACALELCAGSWACSFFVGTRSMEPDAAARCAMLFYVGLTLGRFLSGMLASRLGRRRLLKLCCWVLLLGMIAFMLPAPAAVSAAALMLIGLGVGPVFPNLTHLTPDLFGRDISQSVMGVQQAASYLGIMVMPWLFGLLAERFSTALLPAYLLALLAVFAATLALLLRRTRRV